MEAAKTLSKPLKRINVLDALRGFALLGVVLIHMLQHFGIFSRAVEQVFPWFRALDETIQWIGQYIIMGRFINIFAFLFGLSFFIQMDSASRKGVDFRGRFAWRMVILFFMGILAHSFYPLEIISVYAVFGLIMIPLYKSKNWVLLLLSGLLLVGVPRTILATINNRALGNPSLEQVERSSLVVAEGTPEHIANPSFFNSAKYNFNQRYMGKLNYQFGMVGRGYVTLALFILGLVIGRLRFFESLQVHKRRNLLLFLGFLLGLLLISLVLSMFPSVETRMLFNPEGNVVSDRVLAVKALEDIELIFFSGTLIMGFIILYQTTAGGSVLKILSPYGRMGLTNYLMQGLVGCFLFSMWAFGPYFGGANPTKLFLVGILIYAGQILLSRFWLRHYLYGPLEWLWRSLTYLRIQAIRKKKHVEAKGKQSEGLSALLDRNQ
ncbi:DUF418 domain-containing protein [Echinicola pacifica]|uniref:DUF418 domain-containing protein n=1 Tax=Echinicola pacifica TaxID=346377 RepID=UPI000365708B|nr:DUF418 domain-containing protein [Echinicola pacifica]